MTIRAAVTAGGRSKMMKIATIAIAALATMLATAPADAGQRHKRVHVQQAPAGNAFGSYGAGGYSQPGDPYAVYATNGRYIGRDPDPNVRQRLWIEYYKFGPGSW